MCWVGFMVAIFVKVGQELGGGRADKAKSFALVGVAVSFCRSLYMHLQVSLHAFAGLVGVAVSFCRSLYMHLQVSFTCICRSRRCCRLLLKVSLHVSASLFTCRRRCRLFLQGSFTCLFCMHLQASLHEFAGLFTCICSLFS